MSDQATNESPPSFNLANYKPIGWRIALWLAALPSGLALLLHIWGTASIASVTLFATIPGLALMLYAYFRIPDERLGNIKTCLLAGFLGGCLGTLAYDVFRIPFMWSGIRIFSPIHVYGIWIADTSRSYGITDTIGWTYHFVNGVTFGILYSLFMLKRHWAWAIVWGILLEVIVLLTPFAYIFGLQGKTKLIVIALSGHVAYGVALGIVCHRPQLILARWSALGKRRIAIYALVALFLMLPVFSNPRGDKDRRATDGVMLVEGYSLNPDYLRIEREQVVKFRAQPKKSAAIRIVQQDATFIANESGSDYYFQNPGVYQVYVNWLGKSRSSFIIVEPISETPPPVE